MAELPETVRKRYKTDTFAERLVQHAKTTSPDKAWLQWPDQHRYSHGTKSVYVTRINNGKMWGPGFQGAVRNGVLWARYRGTGN